MKNRSCLAEAAPRRLIVDGREKRSAERIPCEIPVSIVTSGEKLLATAVDLSRIGARIHAPLDAFGLPEDVTLLTVARRLCDILPHRTPAVFDPERLGPLVTRQFEVARIGLVAGKNPRVELGCRFHVPLSTIDVAAVGVEIVNPEEPAPFVRVVIPEELLSPPPAVEPRVRRAQPDPARHPAPGPQSGSRRSPRFRVHLTPTGYAVGDPIHALTERIDAERIVLFVPKRRSLGLPPSCEEAKTLLMALCELIGERPKARILDGAKHVWSGSVRLAAVETFVGDDDALRIELGFGRALRFNEKLALAIN